MNFVAIDFEAAHLHYPCEIGIAIVENNAVVHVESHLIKPHCYPYFHWYAKKIHGIHAKDVETSPSFQEIWGKLVPSISNHLLIAHNADFDMSLIRKNCNAYHMETPQNEYLCSISIARSAWADLKHYSLDALCEREHITLSHHRAGADAEGCAKIVLRAMETLKVTTLQELLDATGLKTRKI